MKINSVGQGDAISKYLNNVGGVQSKPSSAPTISDTVELSEGAQKYSAIMKAAKASAEKIGTDEDAKVADIKARIKNNSYVVSDEQIADSIINGPSVK